MTEMNAELSKTLLEYMEETEKVRSALISKVASLEKEASTLRQAVITADAVRKLVGKLASAGVIDRFNAAYFTKNASDTNAGQCLRRLLGLLDTSGAGKTASAPSPFTLEKAPAVPTDREEREYRDRLANLAKRA